MAQVEVDAVVVGLGPGGERAAGALARAGLDVVGVEMHLVGGECPYYGCIPTKAMVRASNALAEARRAGVLAGSVDVRADWSVVAPRIAESARNWDDARPTSALVDAGVRVVRGRGRLDAPKRVAVGGGEGSAVGSGDTFVSRRGIILDPGTAPADLAIPGLRQAAPLTNRDIVQLPAAPASLIIIGGGPIGCELAEVFARFGTAVTVLEGGPRLLSREEPEASAVIAEVFAGEGIDVRTNALIEHVDRVGDGVTVTLADGTVHAQEILVAAGRSPNLDGLGLESVGASVDHGTVAVDDRMRAADGVWVIGDVVGHGAFTHVSVYQADIAVADLLTPGVGPTAEYQAVSRVTFTDPEVGSVGLTEVQARDRGLDVRVATVSVPASTRGWLHGPGSAGVVKLVAADGVLVGATAVGPMGGEVVSVLTLAVHTRMPIATLAGMHFAFPTFHRDVLFAAQQLLDR